MTDATPTNEVPQAISGIDVMRGVGAVRAKGFWADAWGRVLRRRGAVVGLCWIGVIAFFAVFVPPKIAAQFSAYLLVLPTRMTDMAWLPGDAYVIRSDPGPTLSRIVDQRHDLEGGPTDTLRERRAALCGGRSPRRRGNCSPAAG